MSNTKLEKAARQALETLKVVWDEHPAITALTAALEQPTIPKGWKLVPVKPTAAWTDRLAEIGYNPRNVIQQVLNAAPTPPQPAPEPERSAQQQPVTFNCTVVDDDHPAGVPLSRWGQQEPVAFLANGTRFKMSFFKNEDGPGTYVTCFESFEKELDGRWVALVAAEDDCHRNLTRPQAREQIQNDGWIQADSLLYRLTDERYPQNRDEINVTMADGSRSVEARTRRAGELLDRIRSTPAREPLTDEQRMEMWRTTKFRGNGGQIDWFIEGTRAAEAAHGITGSKT